MSVLLLGCDGSLLERVRERKEEGKERKRKRGDMWIKEDDCSTRNGWGMVTF